MGEGDRDGVGGVGRRGEKGGGGRARATHVSRKTFDGNKLRTKQSSEMARRVRFLMSARLRARCGGARQGRTGSVSWGSALECVMRKEGLLVRLVAHLCAWVTNAVFVAGAAITVAGGFVDVACISTESMPKRDKIRASFVRCESTRRDSESTKFQVAASSLAGSRCRYVICSQPAPL